MTVAEPGALIGSSDRASTRRSTLAPSAGRPGVGNLFEHGLIDAVVEPEQIAGVVDRALDVLCADRDVSPPM